MPMNPWKIYNKSSEKARLADQRIRIVRDTPAQEPCEHEDLVFEKAKSKEDIPSEALMTWKFDGPKKSWGHQPFWFYTTAERCKKMVSEDPAFWTQEKLKKFADIEHRLYEDWWNGHVYGYVVEKWDAKDRGWKAVSSAWGMYGVKDLFDNLASETDGESIIVCIDDESMAGEFENAEKHPNQFD